MRALPCNAVNENLPFRVVNLAEAVQLTGLRTAYVKRLLAEAGVTRLGRNYLEADFLAYFKARSAILAEPRKPFEPSSLRQDRVNRTWRCFGQAD